MSTMQSLSGLPHMHLLQLDVCLSDSIKAAVAQVLQTAGRLDILVRVCE